jgi:hypothetical protein
MRQNWSRGLEVSGMLGKNWSPNLLLSIVYPDAALCAVGQ